MTLDHHPDLTFAARSSATRDLKAIGYWKSNDNPYGSILELLIGKQELPDPRNFIDTAWDGRVAIADYCDRGYLFAYL